MTLGLLGAVRRTAQFAIVISVAVVLCTGAVAGASRRTTAPRPGVFGTVATVNDGSTTGCQTSDTDSFTLSAFKSGTTYTVTVGPTTTYVDPAVTGPTYANICVGGLVGALGTVADDAVNPATNVYVAPIKKPPQHEGDFGTVSSVNDGSTTGCLNSDSGSFTFETWKKTTTVSVTVASTTTYADKAVMGPTYTDVCVGDVVGNLGTVADDAVSSAPNVSVTAPNVSITAPNTTPPGVFGTVATVNSGSTTGCLDSDTSSFTLIAYKSTTVYTVTVASTTNFVDPTVTGPTFANVCVGELVGAIGTISTDTLNPPTTVYVYPANTPPVHKNVFGTVGTVNGGATTGCLNSGASSFTLQTWTGLFTIAVTVSSGTNYVDPAVTGPTYANVCVGDLVGAIGTVANDTINPASNVNIDSPSARAGVVPSVFSSRSQTFGSAALNQSTSSLSSTPPTLPPLSDAPTLCGRNVCVPKS